MRKKIFLLNSKCILTMIQIIFVFSITFILSSQGSFAQAQSDSAQKETSEVASRLRDFLSRLAALSEASPPPGYNASNGWFVLAVQGTDQELGKIVHDPINLDTEEGKKIWEQFSIYANGVRGGFQPGLHSSSGLFDIRLALRVFDATKDQVMKFIENRFSGQLSAEQISKDMGAIAKSPLHNGRASRRTRSMAAARVKKATAELVVAS